MRNARDPRITQIRELVRELARVENADNDTREVVYDRVLGQVRALDRENIINVVSEAIGNNPKRIKYASFVYSELADVSGIDKIFRSLLSSADATGRADIIQTIGLRQMRSLVPALNYHFTVESDDFCRDQILHTLAILADESSLPIFEYLIRNH